MVGGKPHVAAVVKGDALDLLGWQTVLTAECVEYIHTLTIVVATRKTAAVGAHPHLAVVGARYTHYILALKIVEFILIVGHNLYFHLVVVIRHHQNTVGRACPYATVFVEGDSAHLQI